MHQHAVTSENNPRERLKVAFFLNLAFTVFELIGGIFTNSVAILSDAIHDLGDSIAIGSALWLERVSERARDAHYSYGYKRFSTLGALITSVILVAGSVIILYEAIPRLFAPQPVHATGMMWMAILGVLFNGLAVLRLKGGVESLNNRAVMLHLLEDVLGWLAVLVGSLVIRYTELYWIDPLLSVMVSCFILYNVYNNLKSIMQVFLQSVPKDFDVQKLKAGLLNINGVIGVHDVHTWSMDGRYHILSLHLVVSATSERDDLIRIRKEATEMTHRSGIDHPTIALEFENETCVRC